MSQMLVSYMPLANCRSGRATRLSCHPLPAEARGTAHCFAAIISCIAASAEGTNTRLASEGSKRGHIAGRQRGRERDAQRLINEQRRNHGRRRQRPPRVSTDVALATARAADGRGAARNTKEEARRERGHGPARGLLPVCFLSLITLRTERVLRPRL